MRTLDFASGGLKWFAKFRTSHALLSDLAGVIAAIFVSYLFFG